MCEVHPQHLDALHLWQACASQLQLSIGMVGVQWRPAQTVNVAQEMHWLGVVKKRHANVAQQYRIIEHEALRIMNERQNKKP